MVFKGGTSLSKCYKVIHRFSEDIDLAFYSELKNPKLTNGQKKSLKQSILNSIKDSGLAMMNSEEIGSRRNFNKYEVEIESVSGIDKSLRDHLLIETFLQISSFPCEEKTFCSYIGEYLQQERRVDLIETFQLHPFEIKTQALERTFVDKVFAICDYYETGKASRNSRHLYDIHKIWNSEMMDKNILHNLFHLVSAERRKGPIIINPALQPGYLLNTNLDKVIQSYFFQDDYLNVTMELFHISQEVQYSAVVDSISTMIESKIIPEIILGREEIKEGGYIYTR